MRRGCQKVHFQHGQSELKCSFGQSLFVRVGYEEMGRFEDEPKREKQDMVVCDAGSVIWNVECSGADRGTGSGSKCGGRV